MSTMKVCGQTLILVDSDVTLSDVNQKIIKQTLKYMFYHCPENRAFCLTTYGHTPDDEEVFTCDVNDLVCKTDLLEFTDKDSNLTDVLCDVLSRWKDADFACRDIVVFTDGLEKPSVNYQDEELFYLTEKTNYPIYIVEMVQDNNQNVKKQLSAIATTSDGKLFMSEFTGDDADVDRKLSEGIYKQMESYASLNWAEYENTEADTADNQEGQAADITADNQENIGTRTGDVTDDGASLEDNELNEENSDDFLDDEIPDIENQVIYEKTDEYSFVQNPFVLSGAFVALILLIIGCVAGSFVIMKKKKKDVSDQKEILEFVKKNTPTGSFFEDDLFDDDMCNTRLLTEDMRETRLLGTDFTHIMELVSLNDRSNVITIHINDSIVVGRMPDTADIVINDDSVSKRHCRFTHENGEYYVCDMSSSNGTYINGSRIARTVINPGDRIRIGQSEYEVRF